MHRAPVKPQLCTVHTDTPRHPPGHRALVKPQLCTMPKATLPDPQTNPLVGRDVSVLKDRTSPARPLHHNRPPQATPSHTLKIACARVSPTPHHLTPRLFQSLHPKIKTLQTVGLDCSVPKKRDIAVQPTLIEKPLKRPWMFPQRMLKINRPKTHTLRKHPQTPKPSNTIKIDPHPRQPPRIP